MDPESWRQQNFFGKLMGVTIGLAFIAVVLTIWSMRGVVGGARKKP
jgi:hypothetical protein